MSSTPHLNIEGSPITYCTILRIGIMTHSTHEAYARWLSDHERRGIHSICPSILLNPLQRILRRRGYDNRIFLHRDIRGIQPEPALFGEAEPLQDKIAAHH